MEIEFHQRPFILSEVKMEVTYECPLTCIHCSSEATPDNQERMKAETAMGIAKQLIDMGVKEAAISGGEPLVWDGLNDLVGIFSKSGVRTTVYSSGYSERFSTQIKELCGAGLDRMAFSVFAAVPEAHERITRRNGSLARTVESIRTALRQDIEVEIHFVPMSSNYLELPGIVDLAEDLGVSKVSVLRFVPQGRGAHYGSLALSFSQNLEMKRMIEKCRERMNIRCGSPYNFLLINESPKCCAAIDRMIIGPDYEIYPCDAFKQIRSGDLTESGEFCNVEKWAVKECWEKSPYLNAIREYLTTAFPPKCRDCNMLENCLSGCLAQKVLSTGGLKKTIDPMCLANPPKSPVTI